MIKKSTPSESGRSLPWKEGIGLAFLWLLTFALGKLAFITLCHGEEKINLSDVASILWHGLPMDLSTTAYLLLLPWLCSWVAFTIPSSRRCLRAVLLAFHIVAALAVVACLLGDIALYPFWGFKLDATIWIYIDSPKDAVASVSTAFVILYLVIFLLASSLLFIGLRRFGVLSLVRQESPYSETKDSLWRENRFPLVGKHLSFALLGGLLFVLLRGGITESTMNVGNAYFSERQFLNHAAVNPAFSLLASSQKAEHFDRLYRAMPKEEAERLVAEIYKVPRRRAGEGQSPQADGRQSSLTRGEKPSILLVLWEGCGGQLTRHLGGPTGEDAITPCLDSIADTGIFFSQFRANSFRTDRGVLSTLSGHLSYPTHSLMKMTRRTSHLPSLARSLQAAGYTTSFTYGGDINFTNLKGYLLSTGFQHLTADTDFSRADRATAKWGVCDSILFQRLFDQLTSNSASPFFAAALTLSSHEPWDVPTSFRRPGDADERVAAFRYTDHHLGRLLRRLSRTPLWDNLLVVILPDHGVLAADVQRWQDPRFFHVPMVWTGGAVAAPCTLPVVMNQSDLPATLLGQMGLPHDDFPWSRDVLSPAYTRPFAYSTFNDGFAVTDAAQRTLIYDNKAQQVVATDGDVPVDSLVRLGKAIQQCSYDQLEQLH